MFKFGRFCDGLGLKPMRFEERWANGYGRLLVLFASVAAAMALGMKTVDIREIVPVSRSSVCVAEDRRSNLNAESRCK